MRTGQLGRRRPTDFEHVEKWPVRSLIGTGDGIVHAPAGSEKDLTLPPWWRLHDQGEEGACVGFGNSAMMSITNHHQRLVQTGKNITYRYDARWLYLEAQLIDEWDETPPEEGTSVRAGCDVLRKVGHRRVQPGGVGDPVLGHGIDAVRWATSVDEIRDAIFSGKAVSVGTEWYSSFDMPVFFDGALWIGRGNLGWSRGGHCYCLYRMSDRRQAFRVMNSWGNDYPPVWIPYSVMQRLIDEDGEAAVITDR